MKTRTLLFTLFALLLLPGGAGCEKETEEQAPTELYGTWKLVGFGNTVDNTFRKAEPRECDKCYTITFLKEGTITGHTSTNEIVGEYCIKGENLDFLNIGGTKINELFDGREYVSALHQVNFKTIEIILY